MQQKVTDRLQNFTELRASHGDQSLLCVMIIPACSDNSKFLFLCNMKVAQIDLVLVQNA